jgi:hypothetical protein
MLRHRLPGYRRLVREGERADGLVLGVEERSGTVGRSRFRLRIRARLPGGEREVTRSVDSHELLGEYASAGDTVPLRFDPGNAERIDVDLPAWRSRIRAEQERIEAESRRRGEAEWEAGAEGQGPGR